MIPREKVVEIAAGLLEKSKRGEVNWQPSGTSSNAYVVNFPNSYLWIESQGSGDPLRDTYEIHVYKSSDTMDALIARHVFDMMDRDLGTVAELYKYASREATGWDQVLHEIEQVVSRPGRIGLD